MRRPEPQLMYFSADTVEIWANRSVDSTEAADVILGALLDRAIYSHDAPTATAIQAAALLLAEARVLPKLLRSEAEFSRRIAVEMAHVRAIAEDRTRCS